MTAKKPMKKSQMPGRLSVALLSRGGKPDCLRTVTEDGIPMWSTARVIDGALYALDSTHPTLEAATARQDTLREQAQSSQAYASARAKFTRGKNGQFTPALAAVYALPFRGAKGRIEGDNLVFDKPVPKAPKEKKAKAPKAKRGKVVKTKGGAKIVAQPKVAMEGSAAAEVATNGQ